MSSFDSKSGSVTVTGTSDVSISGTPDVNIVGPVDGYDNVEVNVNNPLKIGDAVSQTIDDTERILDLTTLAGADGYPMEIELEARDVNCYVKQGPSGVALDGSVNARIQADQWRRINVISAAEAYVAVQNTSSGESGSLVAVRLDVI